MSHNNWQILPKPTKQAVDTLVNQFDISPLVASILVQRGIVDEPDVAAFLNPSVDQLHSPFGLHDMDRAVARIEEAAFNGEKIVVYGDYDLDGITSTTVMVSALQILGAEVTSYIPNRFTDGYGPNLNRYQQLIADGAQLIITVDNGVSGLAAVQYAQEQGVDVVITDHHSLPEQLPAAYAIVHPCHPEGDYPFGDLSGVGVAFKVVQALLNGNEPVADISDLPVDFLDLVALGEIADMVSLTDENRVLVSWGLKQMATNPRPGIAALLKIAKHAKEAPIIAETVAFKLAPRLNAVGRLADAQLAVDLLLADRDDHAKKLATEIEALNSRRREIVEEVFGAAKQIALQERYQQQSVLLIAGQGWHQGILGIVASRLVDLLHKPVILLSMVDGVYKGSGRSFGRFDLYEFMARYQELYLNFGGHAGALGLSVSPAQLAELEKRISQDSQTLMITSKSIEINAVLTTTNLDESLYQQLSVLEPFGAGNPEPIFEFDQPRILAQNTMGTTQQHLKLKLPGLAHPVEAVAFNHPDWVYNAQQQQLSAFVASLGMNYFRGQAQLQLLINDITWVNPLSQNVSGLERQDFALVYQFIGQHPQLNYTGQLEKVASQLNLTNTQLKLIIQVFVELEFVEVSSGRVLVKPTSGKKPLNSSPSFQQYCQ